MTDLYEPEQMIDTHQHFWQPSQRQYEWLSAAGLPLNADFDPEDVEADIVAAGITGTVLVQAADTYEDTFYMLSVAKAIPRVRGIVAWAPLHRVSETEAALDLYAVSPTVRGIRVLNHNYTDPRWLLRTDVTDSIRLLAPLSLALDVVSVTSEHLAMTAELAARHPDLTIIVDHLAKPDIGGGWEPWSSLLAKTAAHSNVSIKISGLSTASDPSSAWSNWQPYVDHAVEKFGTDRVMLGSDWPVSTLAGGFQGVWTAQRQVIARFSHDEQDDMFFRSATRAYSLDRS